MTLELFCATCEQPRPFEQPPADERWGADLGEWACTDCGEAVLVGSPAPVLAG